MAKEILEEARRGSYYTIIGCGGNIHEWKDFYSKILKDNEIGEIKHWIEFKGSDMNTTYNLTGTNAYPNDLVFLAFRLEEEMNITKLAFLKLKLGDRWFDDVVENDLRREEQL